MSKLRNRKHKGAYYSYSGPSHDTRAGRETRSSIGCSIRQCVFLWAIFLLGNQTPFHHDLNGCDPVQRTAFWEFYQKKEKRITFIHQVGFLVKTRHDTPFARSASLLLLWESARSHGINQSSSCHNTIVKRRLVIMNIGLRTPLSKCIKVDGFNESNQVPTTPLDPLGTC